MLANTAMAITLQYTNVSNLHTVNLNCQLYLNKQDLFGKKKIELTYLNPQS